MPVAQLGCGVLLTLRFSRLQCRGRGRPIPVDQNYLPLARLHNLLFEPGYVQEHLVAPCGPSALKELMMQAKWKHITGRQATAFLVLAAVSKLIL